MANAVTAPPVKPPRAIQFLSKPDKENLLCLLWRIHKLEATSRNFFLQNSILEEELPSVEKGAITVEAVLKKISPFDIFKITPQNEEEWTAIFKKSIRQHFEFRIRKDEDLERLKLAYESKTAEYEERVERLEECNHKLFLEHNRLRELLLSLPNVPAPVAMPVNDPSLTQSRVLLTDSQIKALLIPPPPEINLDSLIKELEASGTDSQLLLQQSPPTTPRPKADPVGDDFELLETTPGAPEQLTGSTYWQMASTTVLWAAKNLGALKITKSSL